MKSRSGFTIVEVIVIVIVIAILATISVFSYSRFQTDARDSDRSNKATLLAEALEKYYDKNGEYPSPQALVNTVPANTGAAVGTLLSISQDLLVMPRAPSGTTNSIASSLGSADVIAYSANSDVNNTTCQNSASGGCDAFTLTYTKEADGQVVTIKSRHSGRSSNFATTPNAPATPTITAAQSSTTLTATSSTTTCDGTGLVAKYAFQVRAGTGAWSAWSAWQTGNTYTQSSNTDGTTYYFQVKTRCDNGTVVGNESAVGGPVSITYLAPLVAPSAPSTSAALSGSNVVATSSTASCISGATAQYKIDLQINDGTWSSGSWIAANTISTANPQQGTKYDYRSTARCVRGTEIATSATGAESPYVHPINAPGAPNVSASTDGNTTTFTRSDVSCPSGTSARYQYMYWADWGYQSQWYGPTTSATFTWGTSSQGYEYRVMLQAQCYNSYATSGWSSTGTGSYIRPVDPPPAPSYSYQRPNANLVYIYGTSSCGPGATLYSAADIYTESWTFTPYPPYKYGWYRDYNGGTWSQNWNYYGNSVLTGTNSASPIPAGKRFKGSFTMLCRNTTTGRESASNGYNESPLYST